jgi:hypothetical protein
MVQFGRWKTTKLHKLKTTKIVLVYLGRRLTATTDHGVPRPQVVVDDLRGAVRLVWTVATGVGRVVVSEKRYRTSQQSWYKVDEQSSHKATLCCDRTLDGGATVLGGHAHRGHPWRPSAFEGMPSMPSRAGRGKVAAPASSRAELRERLADEIVRRRMRAARRRAYR